MLILGGKGTWSAGGYVKGPNFIALHELFDTIFRQDLNDDENYVDLIAERVIQLGETALDAARSGFNAKRSKQVYRKSSQRASRFRVRAALGAAALRFADPLVRAAFAGPADGSFTPDFLALESPMAIACLVERAPCLPSRTWRISSCTNSPACVVADFPARLALFTRSIVSRCGMCTSRHGLQHA
jgi:hypothetical protein